MSFLQSRAGPIGGRSPPRFGRLPEAGTFFRDPVLMSGGCPVPPPAPWLLRLPSVAASGPGLSRWMHRESSVMIRATDCLTASACRDFGDLRSCVSDSPARIIGASEQATVGFRKTGLGGNRGWRWRGRRVRVWKGTGKDGGLSTGSERRRHRGRDGDDPMDDGREDRLGTGSARRQRNGRDPVLVWESAASDEFAVVLGIVTERALSTRRRETGRTARTATGRQRRPDAARLGANPSPSSSCEENPSRPRSRRVAVPGGLLVVVPCLFTGWRNVATTRLQDGGKRDEG